MSQLLPNLVVGSTFTLLGAAKVYGLARGIRGDQGGLAGKLCGT